MGWTGPRATVPRGAEEDDNESAAGGGTAAGGDHSGLYLGGILPWGMGPASISSRSSSFWSRGSAGGAVEDCFSASGAASGCKDRRIFPCAVPEAEPDEVGSELPPSPEGCEKIALV